MEQNVILYGAGEMGRNICSVLERKGKNILCFIDMDKKKQHTHLQDKPVLPLEEARMLYGTDILLYVTILNETARKEAISFLKAQGYVPYDWIQTEVIGKDVSGHSVEIFRNACAESHEEAMDGYFERAEEDENIKVFWGENSPFYAYFKQLDLTHVVELACGRGRHTGMYLEEAGQVTLVDILVKNIEYCKGRFQNSEKIHYYCNNGYDLRELKDDSVTSLFTYDSMVHFELMDIYSYLMETYRVLLPGGKALFHHSNYSQDYTASFLSGPQGRSFNSKEIFAHMAYRSGFKVISQKLIGWGGTEDLDCITMVEKE